MKPTKLSEMNPKARAAAIARASRWLAMQTSKHELADMAVLGDDWWGFAIDLGAPDQGIIRGALARAIDLAITSEAV